MDLREENEDGTTKGFEKEEEEQVRVFNKRLNWVEIARIDEQGIDMDDIVEESGKLGLKRKRLRMKRIQKTLRKKATSIKVWSYYIWN